MSMNGSSVDAQAIREQQQRQQACLDSAIFAGLKASATSLLVSGGLVAGLMKYSEVRHCAIGIQLWSAQPGPAVTGYCATPVT